MMPCFLNLLRPSRTFLAVVLCLTVLLGCAEADEATSLTIQSKFIAPEAGPRERTAQFLPLVGPLFQPEAEISGMAWHGDVLVLLPQYPHKWDHSLFGLHRADLARAIAGEANLILEPFPIPLHGSVGLLKLQGFEGLEAIAFSGDTVYLVSEANMKTQMQGYLIAGTVQSDLAAIDLDLEQVAILPPQTQIMNQAYEALIPTQYGVGSVYEVNGAELNAIPNMLMHGPDLLPLEAIAMPHVEYRLTDATEVNAAGEFWMFNFHWPGSKRLMPARDPIADRWGEGPSQAQSDIVERILKFQLTSTGVELVDEPPLELQLLNSTIARNWEGMALWEDEGFLIVTDQFPTTLLAYVAR